jgi:hypothetical protein
MNAVPPDQCAVTRYDQLGAADAADFCNDVDGVRRLR